jgi:hypothetical protein
MAEQPGQQFCSMAARERGYDPIGTAPAHRLHVMVECPHPWEREILASPAFPAAVRGLMLRSKEDGIDCRPTGLVPDDAYSRPGLTRVFFFRQPEGMIAGYEKQEYLLPQERLEAAVAAFLYQPADLAHFGVYRQPTDQVREIFVCNHGARDRCCGTFGFPLYRELRDSYTKRHAGRLRVWRCSHTGGHRMAPTLLDFPAGRCYGYVRMEDLENLIEHTGPFQALLPSYRGWGCLSPLEQVAERTVFLELGWAWTTYLKSVETIAGNPAHGPATVRLHYAAPDGEARGAYEVEVLQNPELTLWISASCGKPAEPHPQYEVLRIQKLH